MPQILTTLALALSLLTSFADAQRANLATLHLSAVQASSPRSAAALGLPFNAGQPTNTVIQGGSVGTYCRWFRVGLPPLNSSWYIEPKYGYVVIGGFTYVAHCWNGKVGTATEEAGGSTKTE